MNNLLKISTPIFTIFILIFWSCNDIYTPKPHGYIRTDFPEKKYSALDTNCPYKFKIPQYANFEADTSPGAEKYWSNIKYKMFNAGIYISYKKINNNLEQLEEDTRKLAYKHTIKADAITQKEWSNPQKKVYGLLYEIKGDVASQIQFYLTDSTKHFFRGAFYFNTIPNKDSLQPSLDFLRKDIDVMIESFEWKEIE